MAISDDSIILASDIFGKIDTAGTGLSKSGTTLSLATVINAGNTGPNDNVNLTYGDSFTVPYIEYDDYGRVTKSINQTITTPENSGGVTNRMVFTSSGTFNAPKTGIYIVQLISGGGNGSTYSGGNGGKFLQLALNLKQNDSCTITVGAASLGDSKIVTPYGTYTSLNGVNMSTGGKSAYTGAGEGENPTVGTVGFGGKAGQNSGWKGGGSGGGGFLDEGLPILTGSRGSNGKGSSAGAGGYGGTGYGAGGGGGAYGIQGQGAGGAGTQGIVIIRW